MRFIVFSIFLWIVSCAGNGPQSSSDAQRHQVEEKREPVELKTEEKIVLSQQCVPNYTVQTERSIGFWEKVEPECLDNASERADAQALIKSLRDQLKAFQPEAITTNNYTSFEPKFRTFVNDYQKLQNTLAYCRTKRVMQAQSPVPDDKLFLHAVGDVFGSGSGLEGHFQSETIPYRTQVLLQIQKQLADRTYIADEAQSRPCSEPRFKVLPAGKSPRPDITQALLKKLVAQSKNAEEFMTAFSKGDLNATRNLFIKQLNDLQNGESIFLPAGWTKHAVIYQFTRQSKDRVAFRIFNSGEGIGTYHVRSKRGYVTQFFPFVEITDVADDRITSFVFLKALQEIATPGVYKTTPQDFYERLLTALGGKSEQVVYESSKFKDAQQAGTCSYFSTSWLLDSAVTQISSEDSEREAAAQIEFWVRLKSLKSFANQQRSWDETQLSLLRKGLVFVSEASARDYQNDVVDYGALSVTADLGEQVREKIVAAEQLIQQTQAGNARVFRESKLEPTELPNLEKPLNSAQEITAGSSMREADAPGFDLTQDLEILYLRLKLYYPRYPQVVANTIEQLALSLPLQESFWRKKNPEQSISELTQISKLYLFILLNQVQYKQRSPDKISAVSYLTTLKLLTIADLINQKLVRNITPKIPSMYQPRAGLILSGRTSIFETSDPRWQEQVKLMRRYYEPQKSENESFFGFEKYPSGIQGESRRFYDDDKAAGILEDKHWSIGYQYQWPDFKWAQRYVSENHLDLGEQDSPWPTISNLNYRCDSGCSENGIFTDVKRVTPDILLKRKVLLSLKTHELPEMFYQLRELSVVSDFLLTGRFTTDWFTPDFNVGIQARVSTDRKYFLQRTKRYSCTCDDYNYVDSWEQGEYKRVRIPPYDKQQDVWESTYFNQYNFKYDIFGISFGTSDRQPIKVTKDSSYVSPWVNLKDYTQPFVKFASAQGWIQNCTEEALAKCKDKQDATCKELVQNCKPVNVYHYTELLQIWSLGQNRALELLNPEISPLRHRVEPNTYILRKTIDPLSSGETFAKFSLERMRNLMGINSLPELQLKATLDFFMKYPELYIVPEYQVLFEKLMMEPALMQDQLRISEHDSELFVHSLKDFCDAKLELFKKFYDYKSIAFTLHMKQLFYQQVLFAQVKPKTARLLAGAPEELFKVIGEIQQEQLSEKSFLYRNLAEMFLNSSMLSERDAQLLLLAVIEYRATPQQDLDFQDKFAEESVQNILLKQHENLVAVMNDQILDFVVQRIRSDLQARVGQWSQRGALYVAQFANTEIQIDILNGDLFDSGNSRVLFPVDAETFKKVFGEAASAPMHAVRIGLDAYEWSDAKARKEGVRWTFQQKIDGVWYEYLDEKELKALNSPRLVLSGYRYWRSLTSNPVVLKIYSNDSQLAYEVEILGSKIQNFKRLKDGAELIDARSDSSYRVFGQVEDWDQVYIWKNPATHKVLEVDLPRLHTIFKADSNFVQCAGHEGYKVAERQYSAELGNPVNYLICEPVSDLNHSQRRVILMPPSRLGPLLNPLTKLPLETLSTNFQTYFESNYFLTFESDPVLGLSTSGEASRYYLALRRLFQRNYRAAADEIRRTSIELKGLETNAELKPGIPVNPNELQIVDWLISGNPVDSDPRSYAVRLLAAYWRSKHEQYYLGKFEPVPSGLYDQYLEKVARVDTGILGLFEEEQIAKGLNNLARLEQLQKEAQNQPYNPNPIIINPQVTSLSRAENNLSLTEYEKLFSQNYHQPSGTQQTALKPEQMVTDSTFPLLYQILSKDSFNRSQALGLLELVLGMKPNHLTDVQIREEFLILMHTASLSGSDKARFLESVAKTHEQAKKLLTLSQTRDRIVQLKLAREEEQRAWDAYSAANRTSGTRSEYLEHLSSHWYELRKTRENLEQNLREYFGDIRNNDLDVHKIIKNNIQSGHTKSFSGSKNPVMPEASSDISQADIPLSLVAAKDPLKEPLFDQVRLAAAVTIEHLEAAQQNQIALDAQSLKHTLGRSGSKAVQRLQSRISAKAVEIQSSKRFYRRVDWNQFKAPQIASQEQQLRILQGDILKLGQRYASAFEGGALNRVLHLADVGRQISLDDLIYVLMQRNMVSLYNTQGALKLDELNELYKNLVQYLMLSTYLDHVNRFSASIKTARSACQNIAVDDCQIKLRNAVDLATSIRNYGVAQHIEYLVFEYFMKILIRPEQVVALNQLQIKDGHIQNQKAVGGLLELIMGAGKTSVLLPLLSVLDNSNQWLNMIVLPEALVASMSVELYKQLSSAFSRGVLVMEVSRQRYLYQKDLTLLYERLQQAKEQRKTVVTTNSAIQSLFLSFIDRLSRYQAEPHQVSGEIEQFHKIFRFLRQYGRLTIDEVDLALDILQAHQFSVGAPQPLVNDPVLKTIPVVAFSIYREIATNSALYTALDFPFLPNRGRVPFTAGSYQKFRSSLIDAVLKPQFLNTSEDLNRIYNHNISNLKGLAKAYLLSNKASDRTALFAQISDPRLKDVFAVLYDEINHVLPLTAVRKVGVHYGPLVAPVRKSTETQMAFDARMLTYRNSRLIAIPYHSGEPMNNSRFGTPLEALNYSLQLALHQGGYRESVEQEIQSLKKMIFENSPNLANGIFEKRLESLVGPGVHFNVLQATRQQIQQIYERLQKSKHTTEQLELDWLYVIPQVRFNRTQLMTNAQIYGSLFAFVQGFTGTLWSAETFPKIFQDPIGSDTTEKTFLMVWEDYLKDPRPLLVLNESTSYLNQIYSGGFKGSLMDEAGIFRGHSNFEIAKQIRQDTENRVAFYDDLNNLVSCCENGVQTTLKNKAPENHLVAFWDKKHTTGSDIKLMPNMSASMTVDFHITSRSFQQTVWRLRGLGNGQKVVRYAALADDIQVMQERLKNEWKVNPESAFALGDLLLYSVLNEDTKLDELKFRALKQKMKNVVIDQILQQIFAENRSPEAQFSLYNKSRELFEKTLGKDLYLSMGIPVEAQPIQTAIQSERGRILSASYLDGLNHSTIGQQINHLIQLEQPSLPKTVQYSDQEDGNEVEIETETEQEQEQEREEEKEDFSAFRDSVPHKVLDWKFDNFKPIRLVDLEYSNQVHGNPIVNLKHALRADHLRALSNAISEDFLVSLNFAPLHHQHRLMRSDKTPYEFEFFGPYHKNLQDILLLQNAASGEFTVILIDDNDAKAWDEFLRTGPNLVAGERVALYNLSTNRIYRETTSPIDPARIPVKLLVQAGFLAGRVNYPADQLDDLEAFLEHSNAREMLRVFKANILQYKRDTQKAFRGSDIERIFIQLLGSVD